MDYSTHIKTEPECILVEEDDDELPFDPPMRKRSTYPPPPLIPISAYFHLKRNAPFETPPLFTPKFVTESPTLHRDTDAERRKRGRKPSKSEIVRVVKTDDENEVSTSSVNELLRNKIQERSEPVNLSTKTEENAFPPDFLQTMEKLTGFSHLASLSSVMLPQEFLFMMYKHLHGDIPMPDFGIPTMQDEITGVAKSPENTPNESETKKRKRKTSLFIPTSRSSNEISICKFKFTGGSKPSLKEKKMLSLDSVGKLRYYTGKDSKKQEIKMEHNPEEKPIWNQVMGQNYASSCASLARCLGTSSSAVDTDATLAAPIPMQTPLTVQNMEPVQKTAKQIMHETSYRHKIEETIPIRQGDAELFSKFKITMNKPKRQQPVSRRKQ